MLRLKGVCHTCHTCATPVPHLRLDCSTPIATPATPIMQKKQINCDLYWDVKGETAWIARIPVKRKLME